MGVSGKLMSSKICWVAISLSEGAHNIKQNMSRNLKNGTEPIQDGFWISKKLLKVPFEVGIE